MDIYNELLSRIISDHEQYEAFMSPESTVVIAGPGSGKTTVLTMKVIRLLNEIIKEPQGLACITFTKEATREFKQKLDTLGLVKRKNIFLGTVHSFCLAEILIPFGRLYPQYGIPLPAKLISQRNKRITFNKIKTDLNFDNLSVSVEEMDKERRLNIKGLSKVKIPTYDIAMKIAKEYEKRIHSVGLIDYEDIVNYSTLLIQEKEYVRNCLNSKFPWILIDEYQDLGKPLHEMVLHLLNHTDIKIFAVGDPDQSIYGFQGAFPDFLMELYNLSKMNKIELMTNYRSTQDIINGSSLILDSSKDYKAGTRKNENAEFYFITCEEEMSQQYEYVAKKIIPHYVENGLNLEEIAVFVGKNDEAKDLSNYLTSQGIQNYIPKHDFERSDFVKWLESCASWSLDKCSESFDEIFNFWDNILTIHDKRLFENDGILEKRKLYEILSCSILHKDNIEMWLKYMFDSLGILSLLEDSEIYPDEHDNLNNLLKVIKEPPFNSYEISRFTKIGKPYNQVTVTTRHSSKGLEFEVVILLGMEEERFPNYFSLKQPDKLAEESRVCFVCVSRAKKTCILVRSKYHTIMTRYGEWRKDYKKSRFWQKLEAQYLNSQNEGTYLPPIS